jgi:hypothetical protein
MTSYAEGIVTEENGSGNGGWKPECRHCYHFEVNYCKNMDADHNAHMLMPDHPACGYFEEEY